MLVGTFSPTSFSRLDLVPWPRFSFAVVCAKLEMAIPSLAPSQPYKLCQHYIRFPMAAKGPSLMDRGPTKRDRTSARMDGMGLGQSEMLASRKRWAQQQGRSPLMRRWMPSMRSTSSTEGMEDLQCSLRLHSHR